MAFKVNLFMVVVVGLSSISWAQTPAPSRETIIGVTHVGGTYNLGNTTQDYLSQGADQILEMGSKTIKLWLNTPKTKYPFNSPDWPDKYGSLVEIAQHPYYRRIFDKPFKTYILVTYSLGRDEHYFTHGITDEQALDENRQFHDLTQYLLKTYAGTGKTFVLQHWEGDWAIRGHYKPEVDPTPEAITGMVTWLNARQAGVTSARKETKAKGAYVYHAAEVNLVEQAMKSGKPCVVNAVLPKTSLDLVSYSSWDTCGKGNVFKEALEFIAANMPDSEPFGAKNVYIGEYGWPENNEPAEKVQGTIRNVVKTGLEWGCPYLVFWEVYCNEPIRKPVVKNEDTRGFWLIKPDGTKAWAWDYLHRIINGETP